MKRLIAGILSTILVFSSMATVSAEETEVKTVVDKNGHSYSLNQRFTGTELIVIIKREYSKNGKVWEPEFFGVENITEVKDLSYIENDSYNFSHYNQILLLKFADDNKEQILDAVEKVEQLEEVQSAGPNFISVYQKPEPIVPAMLYVDTQRVKYTVGDIDGNGIVDVTDLSNLSLALIGDKTLTGTEKSASDVDGSGTVNMADLARLKQFISMQDGVELCLPEEKELMVESKVVEGEPSVGKGHEYSFYVEDYSEPVSFADVIDTYEEFSDYLNKYRKNFYEGTDIFEKYNKEYFTGNTLIIYGDSYSDSADMLIMDTTITDSEIILRTYQRANGQEDGGVKGSYVFIDVPNELYKNQKLSYNDEYHKYYLI